MQLFYHLNQSAFQKVQLVSEDFIPNGICKFNKYGNFCNFYHEVRKCQAEVCDTKHSSLDTPQNADTSKVERSVSWKNLERVIEKEKEIDSLNKIVKDVKIMQFEAIELDDSFSDTT